jgi:hypothetical protein
MRLVRRTVEFIAHLDRLILVLMAVVATAPFGQLFASHVFLLWAAGAAAIAFVVAAILSGRVPFVVTLLGAVAGLALYLVFAVFHVGVPVLSDLGDVWNGVSGSWHEMLSTTLPAVSSPTLLALPIILAWAACFVSIELAARTRLVAALVLPSLAAFVVGLLLTGQRPVGSPVAPLLLLGGALAVILLRINAAAPSSTITPGVAPSGVPMRATLVGATAPPKVPAYLKVGIPVLIVVTALGIAAGTSLPVVQDDQRVDLRERYEPPINQLDGVTPLAQISAGLNSPTNPLMFKVALSSTDTDVTKIDRIPVASLEDFDGAVWGTGAHLNKVGEELPTGPPQPLPTATVSQSYTLGDGYRSSFLPALDRPISITGDGLLFDRDAGMVVIADGPFAGYRYQITSAVPHLDSDDIIKAAPPGNDPSVADLALLPTDATVPPAITTYANQPQFAAATPIESLRAIEKDMRTNFGYDTTGTPGHSYGVLANFLAAPGADAAAATGRVGDAEQFASAFAVIARLKGLPSRVVVGYKVDPPKSPGAEVEVHAQQIHAWAEVNFRGVGWVAFDPTNPSNPKKANPPPETTIVNNPTPSSLPQKAAQIPTAITPTCDVIANANCNPDTTEVIYWPLFLLIFVIVIPIAIVVAKVLRRRRRRKRGTPAQRVMGAWRETMDRLTVHGVPTSKAMTTAELVQSCAPVAGEKSAARLAEMAPIIDATLYREEEPPDQIADSAWDAEAGVAEAIHEHTGRLARFRAFFDPRPLLPRR